jgi:uncharacterized membrane protein YukC
MSQKNNWKTIGIVFIILCVLLIGFIFYLFEKGNQLIKNENICGVEVCSEYDAYTYDPYSDICTCYSDNVPETHVFLDRYKRD